MIIIAIGEKGYLLYKKLYPNSKINVIFVKNCKNDEKFLFDIKKDQNLKILGENGEQGITTLDFYRLLQKEKSITLS